MRSDISDKIKHLRAKYGLTLEEVANAVGVGKSTVRKWETGQIANMRRDKIASLAAALHTTPAYLMGWAESTTAPLPNNLEATSTGYWTDTEAHLMSLFRQLNQVGQEKLLSYLDDLIRAGIYKNDASDHIVQKNA